MASTYIALQIHIIFATKQRTPCLNVTWRPRLFEYIGGTIRGLNCHPRMVGGYDDHVHLLVGISTVIPVADLVRDIKKASNSWIQQEIGLRDFAWQPGYAALSVSAGDTRAVRSYILNQEEHHRQKSSLEELRDILEAAGAEYDPKFFD